MGRLWSARRWYLALLAGLAGVGLLLAERGRAWTADAAAPDKAAVERARDTARMLDDLYKGFVVQITETYVRAQEKTPAATVAKRVFTHMAGKGWHAGRLVDATGNPFNEANLPRDDFEKRAVQLIKGGKGYYDEVATRDGKPVLRAATVVPVVMPQCLNCHTESKKGDILGALVYEIPIK